jgi:hypothetical protein
LPTPTRLNTNAFKTFTRAEADFKRSRRRRVHIFFIALIGSAYVGEVNVNEFIEGLPDFFTYFHETMPELHVHTLESDIGDWYWGIDNWLRFL